MAAWAWDWAALPGLVSGLVSWSLAFFVYRARPDRTQNRFLAAFLLFAGLAWASFHGVGTLSTSSAFVYGTGVFFNYAHVTAHLFHLLFVSTLPTPIARPFRSRWGRLVIFWVYWLIVLDLTLWRDQWIVGTVPAAAEGTWFLEFGLHFALLTPLFMTLFLVGLAAAIDAYRRAGPGVSRAQTRAYLMAFAVHDGGLALWTIWFMVFGATASQATVERLTHWEPPLVNIWMVCFLAWGILKTQLFDIDLRVKIAFERSTVVSAFLVAFWVGGELVEALLPVGESLLWGLVAAGVVALAFRPLQRAAHRLANRVFTGVEPSDDYLGARKADVYRATIEGALEDGAVTTAERSMMDALRDNLGISVAEAQRIERELGLS